MMQKIIEKQQKNDGKIIGLIFPKNSVNVEQRLLSISLCIYKEGEPT